MEVYEVVIVRFPWREVVYTCVFTVESDGHCSIPGRRGSWWPVGWFGVWLFGLVVAAGG